MAWASVQKTGSPSRKAVLVALADRANADTGRCCPSVELIAEQTEFSVRTVQTALADLCTAGLIARDRRRRSDGSLAGYHYTFPTVETVAVGAATAPPPAAPAGSPPATVAGQEEPGSKDLEPVEHALPAAPALGKALGTVDRLPVSDEHAQLAHDVLAAWNAATGQSLTARDWLAKVVMRIREHPDLTLDDHAHVIAANLAAPWWTGPATPSVVYGSGGQFERSMLTATKGQGGVTARRYGLGMTTEEILRATQGDDDGPGQ